MNLHFLKVLYLVLLSFLELLETNPFYLVLPSFPNVPEKSGMVFSVASRKTDQERTCLPSFTEFYLIPHLPPIERWSPGATRRWFCANLIFLCFFSVAILRSLQRLDADGTAVDRSDAGVTRVDRRVVVVVVVGVAGRRRRRFAAGRVLVVGRGGRRRTPGPRRARPADGQQRRRSQLRCESSCPVSTEFRSHFTVFSHSSNPTRSKVGPGRVSYQLTVDEPKNRLPTLPSNLT